MKSLHALTLAIALSLAQSSNSQAVTFNVSMDLSPLTHDFYDRDFMFAIDWGESFNGNNTLTLSDISGVIPTGPPLLGAYNGNLTDGIRGSGGMIFGQAFATTDDPFHMTVSLTNNCVPTSVFGCNDGDLVIGIVPVGLFGSDESFLHFAVDRPLGIAVNTQIIPTSATGYEVLHPHITPFAPTPEPQTWLLMVTGLVGMWIAKRWKKQD